MCPVFNTSGGIVSLPETPKNTLNFSIRGSLGQNQVMRNIGNFYTSFDATNGAIQQQFSIENGDSLILPTGCSGLLITSDGGTLNLNITKTTGTILVPVIETYTIYLEQLLLLDDKISALAIENPGLTAITGFLAYVPYIFN